MIRLIIEREQVTAITGRIATVDPPKRFQDADDAIYPDFALKAVRDPYIHPCGAIPMLLRSAQSRPIRPLGSLGIPPGLHAAAFA
jgi:hypothetical protein